MSCSATKFIGTGGGEKSMLWDLIQDIEPWDLGVIQKDVAPETVDAMKRTISGMLGLLPSDRIRVVVEALWNPFFKLLLPSIMTGSITIAAMPGQLPDMEMLAQFGCGAVLLSLGAAFPYGVLSMGMVFMAENVK
ncbi:uncharacterized protein LOC101753613 [Setaria italica]|nr:uncharacterized protein LOC101753613 [Setaria italica]